MIDLLVNIVIILFAAKIGGFLSKKIGQPAILGEVLAGLIIGPYVFNLFVVTELVDGIAYLGKILLMFLIGLEFNIQTFGKSAKAGSLVAVLGAYIPFIFGIILGINVFHWGATQSFFLGAILMATSVSISAAILEDFGKLKSKVGMTILDAAILDDILGVVMITFLLGAVGAMIFSVNAFLVLSLKILAFFIFVLMTGPKIMDYMIRFGRHLDLRVKEGLLSLVLITIFLFSYFAHLIGLAALTGAFLAGVLLNKEKLKKIEHEIYSMTYGLFVPFFFVIVGSYLNPAVVLHYWIPITLIVVVAIATKFFGAFSGAFIGGLNFKNSLIAGVGMIPRAEIALIIASIGLTTGMLQVHIYSIIVSSIVAIIFIAPPILKLLAREPHG